MSRLCGVVDGALFFDDYFYGRPVKEDLEMDTHSSSHCPQHPAGREIEKCQPEFSEVLTNHIGVQKLVNHWGLLLNHWYLRDLWGNPNTLMSLEPKQASDFVSFYNTGLNIGHLSKIV